MTYLPTRLDSILDILTDDKAKLEAQSKQCGDFEHKYFNLFAKVARIYSKFQSKSTALTANHHSPILPFAEQLGLA